MSGVEVAGYKKFPYRVEFPDSSERARNSQSLDDSIWWARHTIDSVWRETGEWGRQGEPTTDADKAIITNRNKGYRWILRRRQAYIEFQTEKMVEEAVAKEGLDLYLTVEEAEALARAARSGVNDARTKALRDQAFDQIALLCRQVRERVRQGDTFIDSWVRGIPRAHVIYELPEEEPPTSTGPPAARPKYRPLGDPDNLSLKEAGEILGKARNTVYLWYRQGKFPPAVDVAKFLKSSRPVIIVPRYRLEAWRAGERMHAIFEDVFETHGIIEPPWLCFRAKDGAVKEDVAFWVERKQLLEATTKAGQRIYGPELEANRTYELSGTLRSK